LVLPTNGMFLALIGIGDLDGDGRPDLLGKSTNNVSFALRNVSAPGSLIFEAPVPLIASCGILGDNAQFADLDADGKIDILLGGGSGCPVEIFHGLATPGILNSNSFAPPFALPFAPGNHPLAIADYDRDGKLDVAMLDCGNIARVFRNISTPGTLNTNSFAPPVNFAAGGWPYTLLTTDLNGDGRPDIVTAGCATNDLHCGGICGSNFVSVLQNVSVTGVISSNSFAAPATFSAGSIGTFPLASDMDGDGRPDLIVRTYFGYVSIWRNAVAPSILTQPTTSSFVIENNATTLFVTAGGDLPLDYQWLINGTPITGATNSSINFSNTLFNNRGNYSVIVSNPYGSVTSSVAMVLVRAQPWIYWSTAGELPGGSPNSKIKRAWLDGSHEQTIVSGPSSGRFGGIVCDPVRRHIYSGDGAYLFHVNFDGTARNDLVLDLTPNVITDLGIDLARGKLFWITSGDSQGSLHRAGLDGSAHEIIANTNGLLLWEGLAIDELSGRIYWANNDQSENTIEVANENGSGRSIFRSVPESLPFDVEIDLVERRLYWNEYGHTRYVRANLDGTGVVDPVFASTNGGGNGIHFDQIGRKFYFSSGSTNESSSIYLNRVNPDGSGFETVLTDLGRVNYITVVYPSQTNRLDVSVQGNGTVELAPRKTFYDFGELVTMTASPGPNYAFNGWSDGVINNPRTFTVGFSNDYTASFVPVPGAPRVFVDGVLATISATVTNAATIAFQSSLTGAMIFFTLDASDPAAAVNALLYAGPFLLTESATIRAIAYSSDFLTSAEADPIGLIIVHSPLIVAQPQSQVLAAGDTLVLDVVATGDEPLSYQWRRNGVPIPGVTSSPVLVIVGAQASDTGNYSVIVTNLYGSSTSAEAIATVRQPPMVEAQPSTLNVGPNDPAVFCVTVSGDALLRYQWRKNGVNLPGETNRCLMIERVQVADGGSYSVVVENDVAAVVSASAQLRVNLITLPGGDAFADRIEILDRCFSGSNIGATSQLGEPRHAGKVGGRSIWYKWVAAADGIATFETTGSSFDTLLAVYTGTDIAALTPIAADEDDGGFFNSRVRFNAAAGVEYQIAVDGYAGGQGTYTICWKLEFAPVPLPVIVTQPASQTVRETQPATFTVFATNTALGMSMRFQWFFNGAPLEGETNSSLYFASVLPQHVGYYRVGVSNASVGILSDTAILEIGPVPGVQSVDKLPDLFAPPPTPAVSPVPGAPGLAAAVGTGVQISVSAGSTDSQIINNTGSATSPTEPLPCRVLGGASRWLWLVPTETATLRIDTIGSTIDTVLGIFVGSDPASIVPLANGCNDNGAPDGIRSLVQFSAQAGVGYYVQADGKSGTNGIIRINWGLGFAPASTQNQAHYVVRQGDSLMLTSLATGIPDPAFRWQRDSIAIANATDRVLSLINVQPSDAGACSVVVSNFLGAITNVIATVTVQSNAFTAAQDRFDSTHLAWVTFANATITYQTSGGNPAGYLAFRGAGPSQLAAPPEYLGNKFFCYNGLLSFDLRRPVAGHADVVLVGGGLTLVFDLPNATGTGWTSHKLLLHESAAWRKNGLQPVTHAEFLAVLGAISGLFVQATDATIDVDNLEFLAPTTPLLSLHADGDTWLIQWPTAIGAYAVDEASVLTGNAWTSISAPLTTTNNLNAIRVQLTPGQRFFRLHRN